MAEVKCRIGNVRTALDWGCLSKLTKGTAPVVMCGRCPLTSQLEALANGHRADFESERDRVSGLCRYDDRRRGGGC